MGCNLLFLKSPSLAYSSNKLVRLTSNKCDWCANLRRSKRSVVVVCQGGGSSGSGGGAKAIRSSGSSSVLTENAAVSRNGKPQTDQVYVNGVVPHNGQATLLEIHDGVGIVKFLRGKGLFITGATGFLAKVLIEKILRTIPDVGKIYVLIKERSKVAAMARLKSEIIESEIFKCLRQRYGKSYQAFMLSKLVPVLGNICESNIGMDQYLADSIADDIDVIVNSAANTTFDERYDVAIDINTLGPCRLMYFAKKCQKLKLFLQVSTAYVNGQRQGRIMERPFYAGDCIAREALNYENSHESLLTLDGQSEMELALKSKESFHESELVQKMKQLGLERARKFGWQDTYVFTKAMGEMMIDNMRGDIPVVIIRPSVIESTWREPFPGWMEGNRMMDPIILYYGKGQLTGFYVDPDGMLDVVPADMVVNATLAAIAKHGTAQKPDINVYQIASSVVNPLVFKDLATLLHEHYSSTPYLDSKGEPVNVSSMKLFSSKEDFSAHLWTDATQRSGLTATLPSSTGQLSHKHEIMYRKSVEKAMHLANIYEPYTFYSGRFDNSNTQTLMESMSNEEKRRFGFDVGNVDWRDYIKNVHIPGLRRHVLRGRGVCVKQNN